MPTELHIGIDDEKIVVAPYRVKLRTGRARLRRAGSVVEAVPRPASGRGREVRIAYAARLTLPLVLASAALFAAGLPWWLPLLASAAAVADFWRRQTRAAQRARFAMPADDRGRVLWSHRERAAFQHAVALSGRIRRTWPGLAGMVDPVVADHALRRALDELAGLLAHRQEVRRLRTELATAGVADVPADSPALHALAAQRERVEELWLATGEQANRLLRSIEATALAGETFLREQEIGATARHAEMLLAGLTAGAPPAGSGPELADRTAAVISAYRELAAADPR